MVAVSSRLGVLDTYSTEHKTPRKNPLLPQKRKTNREYQTWSSRDLSLGLETSQDPFLQVLVSVLNLRVLVLVLGLETVETQSSLLMKRETERR